jgi:UDP-N-acetyl-D-glucosamine/UDP-N-acetyl-D-galactosamine dehydrogenase
VGLPESYFKNLMQPNGIFVDLKGIYKGKIKDLQRWSL